MSGRGGEPLAGGSFVDGFCVAGAIPGAAASLWRVTRPGIDFPMVLKMPRAGGDDVAEIVRIEVERRVLPKLTGPHAPRFVASGSFTALPYLVTEFVAGPSLRDRFASVMFSADEVARLGAVLAVALEDLHRQQVILLDLKPGSVIFRRSGEAAFVDFGLARHAQLPDLLAERFRTPLGSAAYMAPEQVLRVRTDPRSDIFALGAVLYHLIAGRPPFGYPAGADGLRRRLYHDPVPPRVANPSCPDWLQEVILACLEVDPGRRYQDAGQIAAALNDPEGVLLMRAARRKRGVLLGAISRRFTSGRAGQGGAAAAPRRRENVPTVMAAVEPSPGAAEPLAEALRAAVRRTCEQGRAVRLACVAVRAPPGVGVIEAGVEQGGRDGRVPMIAELKHWALPLGLPPELISFHVLEADDPASALIGYARGNRVDHIVIGARGTSSVLGVLGGVSARVVAEAPCTVTVVRAHRNAAETPPPLSGRS